MAQAAVTAHCRALGENWDECKDTLRLQPDKFLWEAFQNISICSTNTRFASLPLTETKLMRGMKAQAAVSARCRALGENGDEVMFSLGQCPGVASSPALMRKLLRAFGKMMEAQHLSSSLPPVYDPFTEDSRSWKSSRLLTLCR